MILSIFVVAIFIILTVLIDYNLLDNSKISELNSGGKMSSEGPWTALAYLIGAIGSALAGFIGMNIAVRGNTRTATAAQVGLNQALRVAFNSGAVMGLTVVGIGIIGVASLWILFQTLQLLLVLVLVLPLLHFSQELEEVFILKLQMLELI